MLRRILFIAVLLLSGCIVQQDPERQDALSVVSNAAWLAYQDGPERPWRVIVSGNTATEPKVYTLQAGDLEKRFAVAMACPDNGAKVHRLFLLYASADQVSHLREGCETPLDLLPRHQVSGTIYSTPYRVRLGFVPGEFGEFFNGYALRVPEGETDLIAATGPSGGGDFEPEQILLLRGVEVGTENVGEEQRLNQDLNFSGTLAHATTPPQSLQVVPGPLAVGERGWWAEVALATDSNRLPLRRLSDRAGVTQTTFRGLPAEVLEEGEGHRAVLEVRDEAGEVMRAGVRLFAEPAPVRLTLPAPFDPQALVGLPTLSWRLPAEDPQYGAPRLVSWRLEGVAPDGVPVRWEVHIADPWLALPVDSDRLVLTLPDFAALPGWDPVRFPVSTFDEWRLDLYFSDDTVGRVVQGALQGKLVPGLAYGWVSRSGP